MEIQVKNINSDSYAKELYNLIKISDVSLGIFDFMSESEFKLSLLNGITFVAFSDDVIKGFINFEILSNQNEKFCVHNLAFSILDSDHNEILDILYEKEFDYVKNLKDIKYIIAKVNKGNKFLLNDLLKYGFISILLFEYFYKGHSFVIIKNIKYLYKIDNKNFLLKSKIKFKIKDLLAYKSNGEYSWIYIAYKQIPVKIKIFKARSQQKKLIKEIRKRGEIKVVFFVSALSMWKYQYLYELLANDSKFKVFIVLSPFVTFSLRSQKKELEKLRKYFQDNKLNYIDYDITALPYDVKKNINPDLIFYPQPYSNTLTHIHDSHYFEDKLLAYYPYGYTIENDSVFYNRFFQEIAWKLFYANQIQKNNAFRYAINKGVNVSIVGNPVSDYFLLRKPLDVWKKQRIKKLRVIWAPHFSINTNTSLTNHSNFLDLADFMLELTVKYRDKIQFVFKPHPRLKTQLYENEKWGQEKTDKYYYEWNNRGNCQVEEGDFIDLFLTSDAMIHDSASFCVDYLYTNKPVMFISQDITGYKSTLDDFGKKVLDMHYLGTSKEDIYKFIDNVVLQRNDLMKFKRIDFVNKYLLPLNGKTVAQNTKDIIIKSIFYDK